MSADPILRELRRLAVNGVIDLGPPLMADVVRILELVGAENGEALAYSLASRLTHDPQRWRAVVDALLATQRAPEPAAPPPPHPPPPPRRRSALRDIPGNRLLALLTVTGVTLAVAAAFALRWSCVPSTPEVAGLGKITEVPSASDGSLTNTACDVLSTAHQPLELVEPTRRASVRAPGPAETGAPGPPWLAWTLAGAGVLLLAGAAAAWTAPLRYDDIAVRMRAAAEAERRALRSGARLTSIYRVQRAAPFSTAHIDAAATTVGRLFAQEPGEALDVAATVAATVEAAGRLTPVHLRDRRPVGLVVLVDREGAGHPYLDGVNWLLARWRRLGLHILRYDYRHQPDVLTPAGGGAGVSLDAVRRSSSTIPLMIFSRMRAAGLHRGPRRLRDLAAWPTRVWIDLDPTALGARDARERRIVSRLERLGLPRYPFTADGLVAAARGLVEDSPRNRLVAEPATPAAHSEQLMIWAAVAALVPDASWAQLDALRRRFGGFADVGPGTRPLDPPDVEQLIAWVADEGFGADLGDTGTHLHLTTAGRRALLERLRRHDRERWPDAPELRFEARARRLLLAELSANVDGDPFAAALQALKAAIHRAALDPGRAEELIAQFAHRGVAYELQEFLSEELAVQSADPGHDMRWTTRQREAVAAYLGKRRSARLVDLVRVPTGRRALAALLGLVGGSAVSWGLWWTLSQTAEDLQIRTFEAPAIYAVDPTGKPSACALSQTRFDQANSEQTYDVPSGCGCIRVRAWGGGGGGAAKTGGAGGYAEAVLDVEPGQRLTIAVGGGGGHWATGAVADVTGGVLGGAGGYAGAGSGGYSGVRVGDQWWLVAGGGGGAGSAGVGGGGGGERGEDGGPADALGGRGGTATAAGRGGVGTGGAENGLDGAGSRGGKGGAATTEIRTGDASAGVGGGGGGAGFFGGGGGGGNFAPFSQGAGSGGGGGGSGHVEASRALRGSVFLVTAAGQKVPRPDDAGDRGHGGNARGAQGEATAGQPGLVILETGARPVATVKSDAAAPTDPAAPAAAPVAPSPGEAR